MCIIYIQPYIPILQVSRYVFYGYIHTNKQTFQLSQIDRKRSVSTSESSKVMVVLQNVIRTNRRGGL